MMRAKQHMLIEGSPITSRRENPEWNLMSGDYGPSSLH